MPLETGTYISSLNSSNPAAGDGLNQADDHLRFIKAALLASFPSITGAVTATHTAINSIAGWLTTGASKLADAGAFFASDADTGVTRPGADQVALVAAGTARVKATSTGANITGVAAVSGNATIGGSATVTGAYAGGTGQLVPTGTVLDYAGLTEPTGYLFCYGQAVSRSTYAALYAVIGPNYGAGDGSTTFNLPDLRGRVVAGQDDMGGTSANRLTGLSGGLNGDTIGASGGVESHTLTTAELPAHDHGSAGAHTHTVTANTSGINQGSGGATNVLVPSGSTSTSSNGAHTHTSVGSGTAHNNVQPTLILNKIIKI